MGAKLRWFSPPGRLVGVWKARRSSGGAQEEPTSWLLSGIVLELGRFVAGSGPDHLAMPWMVDINPV